ncbi:MAG: hypothetical protein LBU99_03580 [Spirochaetaceae bacterium]|nr:hypothetical protein [Spirochaetaceae bacterium]
MLRKLPLLVFVCLFMLWVFTGCKSTPEPEVPEPQPVETPAPVPEPPPQEETPPPEPVPDTAYLETQAAAEAARNRVLENGLDSVYPDEWAAAEELYNQDTTEGYTEAARLYDEMYRKALQEGNNRLAQAVTAARKAAVDAGAGVDFPEYLVFADSKGKEFSDLLAQEGSEEEAHAAGLKALTYYQALEKTASSLPLMRSIESLGFVEYSPDEYYAAQDRFLEAEDMIEQEAEPDTVLAAVTEGHDLFVQVLNTGFGVLAAREREKTDMAKAESDSIRADIVLKDKYAAAQELYAQAVAALGEERNEDAWHLFEQDTSAFANIYQEALIRRNAAQAAMDAAARRIEDVNTLADEADIIAPLPEEEALPEDAEEIPTTENTAEEALLSQGGQE